MHRRTALVFLSSATALSAGCAAKPPKPPPSPVDSTKVGMLRVKEWEPTGSTAPFEYHLLSPGGGRRSVPVHHGMGLGPAVVGAIQASREAKREALFDAVRLLRFSARDTLEASVTRMLSQRKWPLVPMVDTTLELEVREDRVKSLPQSLDAILDLQIHGAGYYPEGAVGFVPYLSLAARLLDTRRPGEVIEAFSYEISHGDAKGDPNYFPSPKALIVPTLDAFQKDPLLIREGLIVLYDQVIRQMGEDLSKLLKLPSF